MGKPREFKLEFKLEKPTKNTVKMEEVVKSGKPHVIGQLYVQKWAAEDDTECEVTIKFKGSNAK